MEEDMGKSGSKWPDDPERRRKSKKTDKRAENPLRHGLLAKKNLLPWESFPRYKSLVDGLVLDFAPNGLVELHLVHELAAIIWRKQRIAPAESGFFFKAITKPSQSLISTADIKILGEAKRWGRERKRNLDDIVDAVNQIEDTEGDVPAAHIQASRNVDAEQLAHLARYEAHLDRKFQRILGMLLSLQKGRVVSESRVIEAT
jgi:hypothetical protein